MVTFAPKYTFVNVWTHFWLSQLEGIVGVGGGDIYLGSKIGMTLLLTYL